MRSPLVVAAVCVALTTCAGCRSGGTRDFEDVLTEIDADLGIGITGFREPEEGTLQLKQETGCGTGRIVREGGADAGRWHGVVLSTRG